MCGIAGILNLDGAPVQPEDVRRITRALAHRGPDGEGLHVEGPIGLGHRRLAILDLSDSGKQPMPCVGGRYHVTFNGEIYNFVELRRELESYGHRFVSDSDTEVIGHAYDRWGRDCVLRFNGMWAFALWDTERRELFLSRDRFGIKPLYYLLQPNRFVFASELKSFVHLRGYRPTENEDMMKRALLNGFTNEAVEDTLLAGVRRLRGGFNMTVSAERTKVWRWWRTLEHIPQVPRSLEAQAEELRELFFDACRLRLRSDVPVATCVSGGIDSSAVLCTLAEIRRQMNGHGGERLTSDSHRAFVATFPGTGWDERDYAEQAIDRAGAEGHFLHVSPEMALSHLRQYAYDFDHVGGSLAIPLWCTYRELRRNGLSVSLDGHGADELLAGYIFHVTLALRSAGPLGSTPLRRLDLARIKHGMYGAEGPEASPGVARILFEDDPMFRIPRRLTGTVRYHVRAMNGRRRAAPAAPPLIAPWDDDYDYLEEEESAAMQELGPLNAHLYREFHHTVLPNILRNFDRCSMAHGVEIRMPFMDWRLVCFMFGLPEKSKVGGGFTKRVLRDAMEGILPESIRTRKSKIGFSSPMTDWFNSGLADWIRNEVRTPEFLDSNVWNGPAVRDLVEARYRDGAWTLVECEKLWQILQAHLWRQAFIEGHVPSETDVKTAETAAV